jgi:putative ABC transport system ATP-binding protein
MVSNAEAVPADGVLIEVKDLTRIDPRRQTTLLHATDFQLRDGDRVALTGASGSGKSVLLRTLALLEAADAGQLFWCGQPVVSAHVPHYRKRVCYLAQRPSMIDGTVEDNLRFPYSLKSFTGARFNLDVVTGLLAAAGKGSGFLQQSAAELSGGEAQVVALIRVLQTDPQVMLLDEPTAALDPESARAVEQLVNGWFSQRSAAGHAYLWVSHDDAQAQRMSNLRRVMQAGRISEMTAP